MIRSQCFEWCPESYVASVLDVHRLLVAVVCVICKGQQGMVQAVGLEAAAAGDQPFWKGIQETAKRRLLRTGWCQWQVADLCSWRCTVLRTAQDNNGNHLKIQHLHICDRALSSQGRYHRGSAKCMIDARRTLLERVVDANCFIESRWGLCCRCLQCQRIQSGAHRGMSQ